MIINPLSDAYEWILAIFYNTPWSFRAFFTLAFLLMFWSIIMKVLRS